MQRGKYIVIEGGEGSGKSTQAKLLHESFVRSNIQCILAREPGGILESEKIRGILLDKENTLSPITELFLFEAARAEFFKKLVIPSLEEGKSVISDRSGYSSLAYQGYAGGLDLSLIEILNKQATFGIKPDLAFIIDIHAEKGLSKELQADRFAAKGLEYHTKVNQGFRDIALRYDNNTVLVPYIENQIEETHQRIRDFVKYRLGI